MAYKKRVTTYVEVDVQPGELVTLADAAKMLDMSMPGLIRAIERGALTEIIDEEAGYHGRRLLLPAEVERFKRERREEVARE